MIYMSSQFLPLLCADVADLLIVNVRGQTEMYHCKSGRQGQLVHDQFMYGLQMLAMQNHNVFVFHNICS